MGRTATRKFASNNRRTRAIDAEGLSDSQDFARVVKPRGYNQMTIRCRGGGGETMAIISGVLKGGRGAARLRPGSIVLVERLEWDDGEAGDTSDATYRIMAAFNNKQVAQMRKAGVLPEWMLRREDMCGAGAAGAAAGAVEQAYMFEEDEEEKEIDVDAI